MVRWLLVLDRNELAGVAQLSRLPFGPAKSPSGEMAVAADPEPLSQVLGPLELDALTVADDEHFLQRMTGYTNLPDLVKNGLSPLY